MPRCRLAAPSDAEGLVDLIRSAYRGVASRQGWTSEADLVDGQRIDAEQVLAMIRGQASRMLVLDTDDGLVACCALEDQGKGRAYFGTFAVSPTKQAAGLGRHVIAQAEREACQVFGAGVLEIAVLAQQELLVSWYERLGFRHTGETRPFPADERFARPLVDGLYFVVLEKQLLSGEAE
jgi:N-acetylglutamate synthase-like GNAT family acetyltransferase